VLETTNKDDDDTCDPTPDMSYTTWTDEIADGAISWYSRLPQVAPPQNAPPKKSFAANRRQDTLSSSSKQGFVISKIFTQNAHGLRCRPRDKDGNICPNSPHDYTRYEHIITTMKLKQLDVYFIQETWLEGDVFDKTINGYHVFHHNGEIGNHNFRGVAIILSPCYHKGWKAAGA
jgi:hypothetical protein